MYTTSSLWGKEMGAGRSRNRGSKQGTQDQVEVQTDWAEVRLWIEQLQREWAERRQQVEALSDKTPYRLPPDSYVE